MKKNNQVQTVDTRENSPKKWQMSMEEMIWKRKKFWSWKEIILKYLIKQRSICS